MIRRARDRMTSIKGKNRSDGMTASRGEGHHRRSEKRVQEDGEKEGDSNAFHQARRLATTTTRQSKASASAVRKAKGKGSRDKKRKTVTFSFDV